MTRPDLSIVIPVFRAETVIEGTIRAVQDHAALRGWHAELIIAVSRGGGDRTDEIVDLIARTDRNVSVVDATARFGKGGAIRTGMLVAQGEVCCFIDADNGVSFDQIDAALPFLSTHHIVIGSRYVPGGDAGQRSLARTVVSRGGNTLMKVVLGLPYADTRAPLKVFRLEVARRLFSLVRLRGFGFDSEMLFLAGRLGYRVYELPVRWRPSEQSTVRVRRDALRSIAELAQIRWNWARGCYR